MALYHCLREKFMEQAPEKDLVPEGWTNPPTLAEMKQNLLDATPAHDTQVKKVDRWLDNMNITGTAVVKTPEGSSKVQPKLIRKQAEWRYAALSEPFLNIEEMFKVSPTTWEDVASARQNGLVLNNQINTKIDKVAFIDEYVRTAVDEGTVVVRVGWEFEEEEVTEMKPIIEFFPNPQLAPLMQELDRMKQENPTAYRFEVPEELQQAHELSHQNGIPMAPRVVGTEEVKVMKTLKNCPVLDVCDYRNIYVDPSCKNKPEKAGFIIYSFETSKSELKKAGKYHNLDAIVIDNASILSQPDHATDDTSNFNFNDEPRKKFVAFEYWGFWDYDNSGVAKPLVSTWVGNTLIRLEANPFPDRGLPFVFVSLLPKRKSTYGEPDGELLIDNQKIIGAVTRGMIDIMGKSANGQMGNRKDALDVVNRRRFQQGKDYEYNGGVDPAAAFYVHKYPEIPQSASFMLQQQNYDAESMTGVKVFTQNGISGSSLGENVGNGRSVMDAASKRETGILRRLAGGMVKIGRKMIAMNQEWLDEEEVIRITNEEAVIVRRDDLAGNYDLKLGISTVEEDDAKAQELAFMLQTMGPNIDPGMSKIVLRDIARLRKMPELAHELENYEPKPDPMQQQIQQLQIQKLQLEIQELQGKAMGEIASAQLDSAKTQETMAKTRLLEGEADLNDLEFVEQESGVHHERDMEKQQAQAQGNMKLRAVDHAFKIQENDRKELLKYMTQKRSEK
jgi:hypothetical protein